MRICLVSHEYPPENARGGVAAYTYNMATALEHLSHKVWVVAGPVPGAPRLRKNGKITVVRISPIRPSRLLARVTGRTSFATKLVQRLEYQLAVTMTVRRLERACGLDVVEYPDSYADGLYHSLLCRTPYLVRLHVPHFLSYWHNEGRPNHFDGLVCRIEKTAARRASIVTAPSSWVASKCVDEYGIEPARVAIVPNPIDTAVFSPRPSLKPDDRQRKILYVGWLSVGKGCLVLARAIGKIACMEPRARFEFVGDDMEVRQGNPPMRETLLSSIDTQYRHMVSLSGYIDDHQDLAQKYRNAYVCVVPSLYDNFPTVVLEAMACGVPVIASKVGGIPEMVIDGVTGILIPPGDHEALADAVISLLREPKRAATLGYAARRHALTLYDSDTIARQMTTVYRSITSRSRVPRAP